MAEPQPTISDGTVTLTAFTIGDIGALVDANRDPEILRSAGVYTRGRRDMALDARGAQPTWDWCDGGDKERDWTV